MAPPLFFGIEFEFRLGYLLPGMSDPNPGSEKCVNFFTPSEFDNKLRSTTTLHGNGTIVTREELLGLENYALDNSRCGLILPAAKTAISESLLKAGIPCQKGASLGSLDFWAIGTDQTIETRPLIGPGYFVYPMEITSPAYNIDDAVWLSDVNEVCRILSTQYLTDVHPSCALHIHFSKGTDDPTIDTSEKWRFNSLKKLMMFFWACSPYFMALHLLPRGLSDQYAVPLRTHSLLARELHEHHILHGDGQPVTALWLVEQGIDKIRQVDNISRLMELGRGNIYGLLDPPFLNSIARQMDVSIANITQILDPKAVEHVHFPAESPVKATVEFRKHAGTLDSEQVINWVKTLAGVIKWVEENDIDSHPEILMDLLQKSGKDLEDVNRPTVPLTAPSVVDLLAIMNLEEQADRSSSASELSGSLDDLSVIDLLEGMGIQKQADYYRGRLYSHNFDVHRYLVPAPAPIWRRNA